MEKKSQDFSVKEAQRLAKTPEGQRLMALLRQQDGAALEKAMTQASAGNYKEAGQILRGMLSSPEARSLMEQLEEKHG